MSPNTSRPSPASLSMTFCRCPLAFLPLSQSQDQMDISRGLLGSISSTQIDLIESRFVTMRELDYWGSIINPLWAAQSTDVEEVWNAAESSAVQSSEEPPLSLQLYFTGSTPASINPLPELVDSSPEKHAPDRPARKFLVDPPYFPLLPVQSSIMPRLLQRSGPSIY